MDTEAGPSSTPSCFNPVKEATPCRYFYRSGTCKRGNKCKFSHEQQRQAGQPSALPRSESTPSSTTSLSAQAPEFAPASEANYPLSVQAEPFEPHTHTLAAEDDEAWQDEVLQPQPPATRKLTTIVKGDLENVEACGICMDVPEVYAQHPNCDHLFCPPCLRQWRRQRNQANDKSCPTCRTPSHYTFVTPQAFTSSSHALAVQRFRQRASSTPCKSFTKSLGRSNKCRTKPFCWFGDDCLYQHNINGQRHEFGVGRYMINRNKKGTRRLVRPNDEARSAREETTEEPWEEDFLNHIEAMRARMSMLLSSAELAAEPTEGRPIHHV